MGGFGQVTGQLANDWSQNQQTRQQTADSRTALAQQILSQQIQNQLAQQRVTSDTQQWKGAQDLERQNLQAQQLSADRTYQLAKANHEIAGWESKGVPYQSKDGSWHEDWVKPSTGEKKTYDIQGTPGDIVKVDQQADARFQSQRDMENLRQQNRLQLRKVIDDHMDAYKKLSSGKGLTATQWQTLKNMPAWKEADMQMRMGMAQLTRIQTVRDRQPTIFGVLGGPSEDDLSQQEISARMQIDQAQEAMQGMYDNFTKGGVSVPAPVIAPAPNATVIK